VGGAGRSVALLQSAKFRNKNSLCRGSSELTVTRRAEWCWFWLRKFLSQ
jgi:hypothetical protein